MSSLGAKALYTYPHLGGRDCGVIRVAGGGLGNMLFPWARSIANARRHGLRPIWPAWPQIKVGPILRRERDLRMYFGLFSPTDEVRGISKARLLLSRPRIAENDFAADPSRAAPGSIVLYRGMDRMFEPLLPHRHIVRTELIRITRTKYKEALNYDFTGSVSVHIRLGDFQPTNLSALLSGADSTRIPIAWYVGVVKSLRERLGSNLRVLVFSDGMEDELRELLNLPRVERKTFGSALGDMLALARARLLVASGSTFSMWGVFLGRVPSLWLRGQRYQRLLDDESLDPEIDMSGGIPESFIGRARPMIFEPAAPW